MPFRWSVRTALSLAVVFGIVCRVVQYLWRRSYWHDESYLVLNIMDGKPGDAFGPLRHYQSAPPVFMWIEFAAKWVAGTGEYALRFVPLLWGIASLVMFAVLARRVAGPVAAAVATAMFAVSDRLVWHSVEAKQYSSDVFVALVLLLLATGKGTDRSRFIKVALASVCAVWLSHPTVFVFGGISLAFLLTRDEQDRTPIVRRLFSPIYLLGNASVVASFAVVFFTSARHQQYPYLFQYWLPDMVPWARWWTVPQWTFLQISDLFDYPYEDAGPVLLLFGILGAIWLWRDDGRRLLGLLLLPAVLTFMAAALHRYPFAGTRVTVFLSPAILLLSSIGIGECAAVLWSRAKWRPLAYALPLAIVAWGVVPAIYDLFVPKHNGHIRPVAEYAQAHRVGSERVYVLGETEPLDCYWRAGGVGVQTTPETLPAVSDTSYWVLYAYSTRRGQKSRDEAVKKAAEKTPIVDHYEVPGGTAVRFAR